MSKTFLLVLFVSDSAIKIAVTVGVINNTTRAIRIPLRSVTKGRRDMYSHHSTVISVMMSNVADPKYWRLTNPINDRVLISSGRFTTVLGLSNGSKSVAARKGTGGMLSEVQILKLSILVIPC